MKLTYDPKVDAVYIHLAKGKYSKTRKVSEAILVDETEKGEILGIEILDAQQTIPAFNPKKTKLQVQSFKS